MSRFASRAISRLAASVVAISAFYMVSAPAHAWYSAGHMAIALLAYREMKPATRIAVDALLVAHPDYAEWVQEIPADVTRAQRTAYIFAIASTWPDRIKNAQDRSVAVRFYDEAARTPPPVPLPVDPRYPNLRMHKDWHYIDYPIDADGKSHAVPQPNAVTQITFCRVGLSDRNNPVTYRAYYLAWVEHLVGDVHQPLHCGERFSAAFPTGDAGGNAVRLAREAKGDPNNLHAYWDALLGNGGGDGPGGYSYPTNWADIEANASAITADAPRALAGFDAATRDDLNPDDWARESFAIDRDFVYTFGPDGPEPLPEPGASYHNMALLLAHGRAALAAHRLARMLDSAVPIP